MQTLRIGSPPRTNEEMTRILNSQLAKIQAALQTIEDKLTALENAIKTLQAKK